MSLSDDEINLTNEFGQNLLQEALAYNAREIGVYVIMKKIDVNRQDKKGQTPLHYTALYKDVVLAEEVIKTGGTLDISDNYGNNPIWTAVFNAKYS